MDSSTLVPRIQDFKKYSTLTGKYSSCDIQDIKKYINRYTVRLARPVGSSTLVPRIQDIKKYIDK
jgi:hypothetical protein